MKKKEEPFVEEDIYDWYNANEKRKDKLQTIPKLDENKDLLAELADI